MFFDFDNFAFSFGGSDEASLAGDAVLGLDPNAPPPEWEIDWSNIDFGNASEQYPEPPSFINGGLFDAINEFYSLLESDPNINAVLDAADLIYVGNLEFELDVSMGDIFAAFAQSYENGHYYDVFGFYDYEDLNDFSYQYNYDEESDGWIKEYV